jgi:hypothetical protein
MAPADAEHCFAFTVFDCPVHTLAVLVAYLGTDVRYVDSWPLAGCKPTFKLHHYPVAWIVDTNYARAHL